MRPWNPSSPYFERKGKLPERSLTFFKCNIRQTITFFHKISPTLSDHTSSSIITDDEQLGKSRLQSTKLAVGGGSNAVVMGSFRSQSARAIPQPSLMAARKRGSHKRMSSLLQPACGGCGWLGWEMLQHPSSAGWLLMLLFVLLWVLAFWCSRERARRRMLICSHLLCESENLCVHC